MQLDERKWKILQAIIKTYLETGEPVGSRTISKYADLNLSSATIRNEMADLEELGYIIQPHTSAGRIPSDLGYRLYVNHLMEEKEQQVLAGIHKAVNPDHIELESDLALIAIVGRGMRSTRGTAGRIFSALAHAHINVKMIDQGSSELNIIVGVRHDDFKNAIRALYQIFVETQI